MTRLSIAIPSKGRLKEKSEDWLTASGFKLRQKGGGRGYSAELKGLPDADIMLLSAREIAEGLISGELHVGITGQDLMHDLSTDVDRDIHVLRELGFGGADVIVAVPAAWIDVETMAVGEYRLIESAGATEAAPASGTAEVIVDITTTGATLKANGLKVLSDGPIMKSQAVLAGSLGASWDVAAQDTLRILLDGVEAAAEARRVCRIETSGPIPSEESLRLNLAMIHDRLALCPVDQASKTARELTKAGVDSVLITTVEQVFQSDNAVFSEFVNKVS